ncbi:helix-turn-helix domain-containing protein [Streptomyces sp. NPDC008240]|uniref:helix-turn-helix domain-containing protein n=1 Tax=Streptomyces sp. NPDC008240 TaxID=3364822 RepID=UPI0036F00650
MPDNTAGAAFAELLRELKDRSGLSYGVLAKRLHMSTSTLHRYCNGDAVPTDYAPVERLARLCKASPDELVELHRRWVVADAMRGRGKAEATGPGPAETTPAPVPAENTPEPEPEPPVEPEPPAEPEGSAEPEPPTGPERLAEPVVEAPDAPTPTVRRRTRTVVAAGIAVAAVIGAVALAVNLTPGGSDAGDGRPLAAASTPGHATAGGHTSKAPRTRTSPSASASVSASPSGSPSEPAEAEPKSDDKGRAESAGGASDAAPLTVATSAYTWDSPCDGRYLINRPPAEVAPPPTEDAATAWVAAHGAVSSGKQEVTLTVQGTGKQTVVVESLTVHTITKRTPLAWNDYAMAYPGVGCGGKVPTRSFTVALDSVRPAVQPESGQQDFPFKVSESDPEVFHVTAEASAYDVSWSLSLAWSSGSRHGVLQVDNHGRLFRTSGNNGRPAYEFPLGGSGWVKEGTTIPE